MKRAAAFATLARFARQYPRSEDEEDRRLRWQLGVRRTVVHDSAQVRTTSIDPIMWTWPDWGASPFPRDEPDEVDNFDSPSRMTWQECAHQDERIARLMRPWDFVPPARTSAGRHAGYTGPRSAMRDEDEANWAYWWESRA